MTPTPYHIPALLPQTLDALRIKPGGTYIDATLGGAGHTRAITQQLDHTAGGHLYAFDQDPEAIANAFEDPRLTLIHGNFRYLTNFMRWHGVDSVDGILADLGVSFHHFDTAGRGFSFRLDPQAPLDMRMNPAAPVSAATLLAETDAEQLASWLKLYGELSDTRRLAAAILAAAPVTTVGTLVDAVTPLLNPRRLKKELACVFQALRMVVNDETAALRRFLESTLRILAPGGRLAVITYHSLEDRLVKNFMRTGNVEGKTTDDPLYGRQASPLRPVGKPITPDDAEIAANPRSRSARLRVAEKI